MEVLRPGIESEPQLQSIYMPLTHYPGLGIKLTPPQQAELLQSDSFVVVVVCLLSFF